ncbi:MAG TPA: hypothetical protein VHQ23_13555 [Ilumatobacteraceae bacterium]|nr:hypothetical protein [Ilumatobacteraceae bacterium]
MKSRRHIARLIAAGVLVVGTAVVAAPSGVSPVQAATCTLCGGGEFHPLTPSRIFDSRPGLAVNDVAPAGLKPLGAPEPATFDISLLGKGNIPADAASVLAVVVNITVTEPGANGYLEAYGKGAQPAQHTSIINFGPGQTVPNVAIVRPGADGALTIGLYGLSGSANVLVDVFGWFSTSAYTGTDGARLIPTTPSRILDTRDGTNRSPAGPLGASETMTLQILGADGVNPAVPDVVPAAGVTGVLLNVVGLTNEAGGTATHLSLFPNDIGGAAPATSNLNLAANVIKANLVFVPVGTDGKIRIFNDNGNTQVVADVVGYMLAGQAEATRAGRVVPLTSPYRTFDTRQANFGGVALGPGQAEDWSFADFASSVFIGSASVGAQLGVIGNLTSAELKRQYPSQLAQSYLTAYPSDAQRPTSSNLNTIEGPPIPNMAVLKYGANATVRVYNNAGYEHYLFDASAVILAD